jgi:pilus assembly protein CpaB
LDRIKNPRVAAIFVAVILAMVATVALLMYVRGVESEVRAEVDEVEVLVAREEIPAGAPAADAASQGLIVRDTIPRKNLAEGAVTSVEQIDGRVATVNIAAGEQILAARFAEAQEQLGLAEIPEGLHAISVQVGIPPGVAGFVNPGSRVSLIADTEEGGTAFLVQDVEVLALGQRVVTTGEDGQTQTSVRRSEENVLATLAVEPGDAERIVEAVLQGQLYFTLLPDQE